MKLTRGVLMGSLVLAGGLSGYPSAQERPRSATVVRAISIAARGNETVVTITADGPLPVPTLGVLDDPPRIFVDFNGLRPATAATIASREPSIRRVRVALNSANPL